MWSQARSEIWNSFPMREQIHSQQLCFFYLKMELPKTNTKYSLLYWVTWSFWYLQRISIFTLAALHKALSKSQWFCFLRCEAIELIALFRRGGRLIWRRIIDLTAVVGEFVRIPGIEWSSIHNLQWYSIWHTISVYRAGLSLTATSLLHISSTLLVYHTIPLNLCVWNSLVRICDNAKITQ